MHCNSRKEDRTTMIHENHRRAVLTGIVAVVVAMVTGCGGGSSGSGGNAVGGIASSSDRNASVTIPNNDGVAASSVTVKPAAAAEIPATNYLVPGTAYDFSPGGTQFTTPVSVTLKYA